MSKVEENKEELKKSSVEAPKDSTVSKDGSEQPRVGSDGQWDKGSNKLVFLFNKKRLPFILLGGFVAVLMLGFVLLSLFAPGPKQEVIISDKPAELELEENNNSEGYLQTAPATFGAETVDVSYALPAIFKTEAFSAKLNEQISWPSGFALKVVGEDRDYRPVSEFSYKQIAESGDELVRVNIIVGNAGSTPFGISYDDLALYAVTPDGTRITAERIPEDVYSPRSGQQLSTKQTRTISLHYRVKRDSKFVIEKSQKFEQRKAKKNLGEEKEPTLSLRVTL